MNWILWISIALSVLIATGIFRALKCAEGWEAWVCYQIARLQSLLFFHWKATNTCTIPEHGPAIIVANHTSPVDPAILWIRHFDQFKVRRLRVIGFMMAREYYVRGGVVSWVCRAMQSIPVDRDGKDMAPAKDALQRLKEGRLLGLFPEGRLNTSAPNERLLPGGTGVAWLALKANVPVIPVFIHDAPRSSSMVRAFFTWTHTRVTYGQPLDLSKWQGRKPTHQILSEMTDFIMESLAGIGGVEFTPVAGETSPA
ncbi:MAG: 1-acyl-sn-glycerol-3-phosphate acyltransferase [Planctomyces sp.]|nr:1-acyl-sn-glycerol-3-phosphate acyltransferase [Planctomyces sp.]